MHAPMRSYLIVDDNAAFAENLAEILHDRGAEVDVVSGGEAALVRVHTRRYDLLISDMRMPMMGGSELIHRARRVDPGLPAVLITAYTHDRDLEMARQEGLLAVLPKPAPIGRLLELCQAARRDGLVVLIEDEQALADNLCEVLSTQGYSAVTASSMPETERLNPVRPFAALVDLRIPGGPDGAAMVHLAEKFPGLPMFVVTGHEEVPPPAAHQGLFKKPFDTGALLDAVGRIHGRQT